MSGYFLFHLFRRDSIFLFYSASQKPSLLCQKDQAARFCPSFGTSSYKDKMAPLLGLKNVG
ncbi:hypothetical protein B9T54_05770 [Leptospira borgpetersenii serovar Hardjo-bovis]|nr:hypothetical protein B9T54_05770 [Leptospira borgpetersenii serovar Hardjo-bovis]TQE51109.1 hypothetical protein FFZ95_15730 [Leptospira borgpetersenii]